MQIGAVIVAAGMSSRMGDFKPMLNIGSISIAQRIVATLKQAGVTKTVMVTGYKAASLEHHLANNGIVFLRNEDYENTQMFDSAKIGLSYLKDKCDKIIFTPVDIPLFTASTVSALIDSGAMLACPVCDGQRGHPTLMDASLVDKILADDGSQGLKGAMERCGEQMREIEVRDQGILHDADTPEDYEGLLNFHNKQLMRPVISVSLAREQVFFDERMAMLLSLVDETSSVLTACQMMQISYSTGWNIIRKLESQLSRQLIVRTQGGAGGGMSFLTDYGKHFLSLYQGYAQAVKKSAGELFEGFFKEEL